MCRHFSKLDLIEMATCHSLSINSFVLSLTLLSDHHDNREAGNNTEIHSDQLVNDKQHF